MTKAFNQRVQRNIEKFDEDFRFQLTPGEWENLRSQFVTSSWGGTRYLPHAFTEQGVYMLMTVLRGDLATKQSKALIRLFKRLKDHAAEMGGLAAHRDLLRLSMLVADNADAIRVARLELVEQRGLLDEQRKMLLEHDDLIAGALEELGEAVKRSEISPVLLQFDLPEDQREFLLLNGRAARADVTYMGIYARARKSVYIVDNYIGLKTLYLLQSVAPGVAVTVFSDNLGNRLHASDFADFRAEFPGIPVTFTTAGGIMHDRFVVLDYGDPGERYFHCGASSKDAAVERVTAITELVSADVKAALHALVGRMRGNPPLALR